MSYLTIGKRRSIPKSPEGPLMRRDELERSESTLVEYTLTEDERQAIIQRYGAPTRPMHKVVALEGYQTSVKGPRNSFNNRPRL